MICIQGNRSPNRCGCNTNSDCRFGQLCDSRTHSCIAGLKKPQPGIDPGKLKKLETQPIGPKSVQPGAIDQGTIDPGTTGASDAEPVSGADEEADVDEDAGVDEADPVK